MAKREWAPKPVEPPRRPPRPKLGLTQGADGAPVQPKAPNALIVGGRARIPNTTRRPRASAVEVSYLSPEELSRRRVAAGLSPQPPA